MPKRSQNAGNPTVWMIGLMVALCVPVVLILVLPLTIGLSMRFIGVILGAVAAFLLGMGFAALLEKFLLPNVMGNQHHHPAYGLVKGLMLWAYPAVLAALWYFLASAASGVTVHIDNATNQAYVITVDGKPLATVANGTSRSDSWRYGTHDISVADSTGQVRDTFQVTISTEGPWVFNLLGAGRYVRGTAVYGTATASGPDVEVADRWIEANVSCLFENPPQSVSTKGSGTTRTFLIRKFAVQSVK